MFPLTPPNLSVLSSEHTYIPLTALFFNVRGDWVQLGVVLIIKIAEGGYGKPGVDSMQKWQVSRKGVSG